MADEQKPKGRKKPTEPADKGGTLATAAKAIGTAAGKIASRAGMTEPAPAPPQTKSTKSKKKPKLEKKNKSRLPRKEKKARQKAAATQAKS